MILKENSSLKNNWIIFKNIKKCSYKKKFKFFPFKIILKSTTVKLYNQLYLNIIKLIIIFFI